MTAFSSNVDMTHLTHRAMSVAYTGVGAMGLVYYAIVLRRLSKLSTWFPTGTLILHIYFCLCCLGILAGIPFAAYSSYVGSWQFGNNGCQMYAFSEMMVGTASLLMFSLLCLDRYGDTCGCAWYKRMKTSHFHLLAISAVVFSALWCYLPILGFGKYELEPPGTACLFDFQRLTSTNVTYLWSTAGIVYVTCFLLGAVFLGLATYGTKPNAGPLSRARILQRLTNRLLTLLFFGWLPYTTVFGFCMALPNLLDAHSAPRSGLLETMGQLLRNPLVGYVPPLAIKLVVSLLPMTVYLNLLPRPSRQSATAAGETKRRNGAKRAGRS